MSKPTTFHREVLSHAAVIFRQVFVITAGVNQGNAERTKFPKLSNYHPTSTRFLFLSFWTHYTCLLRGHLCQKTCHTIYFILESIPVYFSSSTDRRTIDSVVVSTCTRHTSSLGPIPSHGKHGIFDVNTWLLTTGQSLMNRIILLMLVLSQFGDKHPGSDHPQCQHSRSVERSAWAWRKYSED